jgi:Skp family chaperone for outer membrane proteins
VLAEVQQPRRALSAVAPAPAPGAANVLQSLLSTAANEQTAEVQDLDQVMAQLQSEAAQEDQQTQQSEQSQAQSDDAQQNHQLTQQEAGATNLATQHPKIPTLASFAPSPPPPPRGACRCGALSRRASRGSGLFASCSGCV